MNPILILLLLMVAIGGGYFAYQKGYFDSILGDKSPSPSTSNSSSTPTITVTGVTMGNAE
jgi:hypothetical protein